jgi:hypothetical protein
MSSIVDPTTRLGYTNKTWGICGFTSTLSAMYDLNQGVRGQVINGSSGYRMLAEIKIYLEMLKAAGSPLLADIRSFTRSFGPPYDTFEVDEYIARIDNAAGEDLSRSQILAEPRFSIGMPPAAVADYIQRQWGWKATVTAYAIMDGAGDGIVGVTKGWFGSGDRKSLLPLPYYGLCHYLYRSNGAVYSWGIKFDSVREANAEYRVCYVISVSPS